MSAPQPPDRGDFAAEPRSIDLREYWLIVRRRWVLVLVVTMLGAVAGLGYAKATGKSYSATAQVVVAGLTQGPLNSSTQASPQVNMSTEQAVAQSAPVIEQAAKTLGVQPSTLQAEAAKRLTVTVPGTSLTTSNVLADHLEIRTARITRRRAQTRSPMLTWPTGTASWPARSPAYESVLTAQMTSLQKQIARVTAELGNRRRTHPRTRTFPSSSTS